MQEERKKDRLALSKVEAVVEFLSGSFTLSQIILRSKVVRHHSFLPKVIILVRNGNVVLNRLVPYLKCMELAC